MLVCSDCGAHNRERARFCRGCARALVAATVVQEPKPDRTTRACPECQAPNPRRALRCLACGAAIGRRRKSAISATTPNGSETPDVEPASLSRMRWLALAGVLLVLVGALAWWMLGSGGATPPLDPDTAIVPANEVSQSPAAIAPVSVHPASASHSPTTASELADAVEEIRLREERKEAERLAAQEDVRAAKAAERKRAQAARAKAAKAAEPVAPVPTPPPAEPSPIQEPSPKAPVAVAAPVPVAPKTVEQSCAGETNVFARDFCRAEACRQKVNADDPICVWYRKIEAERRSRLAN